MPLKAYKEILEFNNHSIDYYQLKKQLQTKFTKGKHLVFAYAGYEPFTPNNGLNSSTLMELIMDEIKKDLDVSIKLEKSSWSNIKNQIEQRYFNVIMDPVIPSSNRQLTIIPYLKLGTNILFYNSKLDGRLGEYINDLSSLSNKFDAVKNSNLEKTNILNEILVIMHKINDNVAKGFSITDGVREELILTKMGIPVSDRREAKNGIVTNIKEAAEDNYIVLCDLPSAIIAQKDLDLKKKKSETNESFFYSDLFGSDNRRMIDAGFAFHPSENINLVKYFMYNLTSENGLIRKIVDRVTSNGISSKIKELEINMDNVLNHPEYIHPITPSKFYSKDISTMKVEEVIEADVLTLVNSQIAKTLFAWSDTKEIENKNPNPHEYWKEKKEACRKLWREISDDIKLGREYLSILHGAIERERMRTPYIEANSIIDNALAIIKNKIVSHEDLNMNDLITLENDLLRSDFKMLELDGNLKRIEAYFGVVEEIDDDGVIRVVLYADEDETYFFPKERVPKFLRYYGAAVCWINRIYVVNSDEEDEEGRFEPGGELISPI